MQLLYTDMYSFDDVTENLVLVNVVEVQCSMVMFSDQWHVSLAECSTHEIHQYIQLSCFLGTYKNSGLEFWNWRIQDGVCGSK